MSDAVADSQAVATASILLTVYYWGRRGQVDPAANLGLVDKRKAQRVNRK
jgi:hypothetical protein